MQQFYAALARGSRRAYLAGPYARRELAEAVLAAAHEAALEFDPFCHFDTPLIIGIDASRVAPAGRLNKALGLPEKGFCDFG